MGKKRTEIHAKSLCTNDQHSKDVKNYTKIIKSALNNALIDDNKTYNRT